MIVLRLSDSKASSSTIRVTYPRMMPRGLAGAPRCPEVSKFRKLSPRTLGHGGPNSPDDHHAIIRNSSPAICLLYPLAVISPRADSDNRVG